jgi:hypothetical protein
LAKTAFAGHLYWIDHGLRRLSRPLAGRLAPSWPSGRWNFQTAWVLRFGASWRHVVLILNRVLTRAILGMVADHRLVRTPYSFNTGKQIRRSTCGSARSRREAASRAWCCKRVVEADVVKCPRIPKEFDAGHRPGCDRATTHGWLTSLETPPMNDGRTTQYTNGEHKASGREGIAVSVGSR